MEDGRIVLLGDFDGVHAGHREIVREGVRLGKKTGCKVTVWTFDSIRDEALTSLDERKRLLLEAGADEVIFCKFEDVRDMSCEDFVKKVLCGALNAVAAVCGYNYSFGRGGTGTPSLLAELCSSEGVTVSVVDEVRLGGSEVSSSVIRSLIRRGKMREAATLLGRYWSCGGVVGSGAGLGRTVGMPTVNLCCGDVILPAHGVYATVIRIGERSYPSVTNVGVRPTVNDGRGVTVETHIIDFDGDLYGESVRVEFVEYLREERAFGSLEELSAQVKTDCNTARKLIADVL